MIAKKSVLPSIATATIGSLFPTLIVLHMMADNNNNGELFDTITGRWDVGYAFAVGSIWYGLSFLPVFGLSFLIIYLWKRLAAVN